MKTEANTETIPAPYTLETRFFTEYGWTAALPRHEFGDRTLALAAFDADRREHQVAYGFSGEWRLVLLGPDRIGVS